ncbi:MAG TPA: hypothetical protein VGN46_20020 [Luteibacter sp.]|jgi:hypothetical protein|uniref:hypothetical protein n=1 Tax=Luteibacter sp. TaxID=1886636 RepID=UPI002F406E5B
MNDMNALKRGLLEALGPHLLALSFKPVFSQQSFRRAAPNGWLGLHLAFVNHDSDFDITLDAGVRFSNVQDAIVGTDREAKHSATIGCEYGRLTGQGQFRWTVAGAEDVDAVAANIFGACTTTMIPFVEHYADMGTVLETLKRNDATSRLISPIEAYRVRIVEFMSANSVS